MNKHWILAALVVLVLAVALSACGQPAANPTQGSADQIEDGQPPAAAEKAREMLAAEIGIEIEQISIVSFTQTTWQDSCLGLGGIAESCLVINIEGWLVELLANDDAYNAHTDSSGDQIRLEP